MQKSGRDFAVLEASPVFSLLLQKLSVVSALRSVIQLWCIVCKVSYWCGSLTLSWAPWRVKLNVDDDGVLIFSNITVSITQLQTWIREMFLNCPFHLGLKWLQTHIHFPCSVENCLISSYVPFIILGQPLKTFILGGTKDCFRNMS